MIGVLLSFSVVVLIGFRVASAYDDNIQGSAVIAQFDTDGKAAAASSTLKGHYTGIVDNMFLVLTIGFAIATLILAVMVRVHPIFIPFFFIILMVTIFVAGIASNIYQGIAENSAMAAYAESLTFISLILEFLPLFTGVLGTILMVVMYKLWQAGQ